MLEETRLHYALVTVFVEVWTSIGSCRRLLLDDVSDQVRVAAIRPRNGFGMGETLTAPNLLLKAETYPRRQRVV
jgi:hypothetical protein